MTQTIIQKVFAPLKACLPPFLADLLRSGFTALVTPLWFSYKSGHFRSSFQGLAVSRKGKPVPWYTYPCIDFLKYRSYLDKTVLEFGGGQSTLWWAKRAKHVVTLEGDEEWYQRLRRQVPGNVDLFLVSLDTAGDCVSHVNKLLQEKGYHPFDVIIIDGLYRNAMIEIAPKVMAAGGAIICDDAESFAFYEAFKQSGMKRVDFFGHAPGVVLPRCTSIFFKEESFLFSSEVPIPVIAEDSDSAYPG